MNTVGLEIPQKRFLRMLEKIFTERKVWNKVIARYNKTLDHYLIEFHVRIDVDILQEHEIDALTDLGVKIIGLHPYPEYTELRIKIGTYDTDNITATSVEKSD